MSPSTLTPESLARGAAVLADLDPDLGSIVARFGLPPLWNRPPGFPTLVRIILEQQVSLASASAAYQKLEQRLATVTPERFVQLSDVALKQIGFSRQKSSYCRSLAESILMGEIDLIALDALDDTSARSALLRIKGVGPWTADIYLLMAMLRPDVWPSGDLALAKAAQDVKSLAARPGTDELHALAEPWRPWRAIAARLLWHYYLSNTHGRG